MSLIDMWVGSSVVECMGGIPKTLGSNPGRVSPEFWRQRNIGKCSRGPEAEANHMWVVP